MLSVILPLLTLALEPQTNGARLKELVSIEGVRDNQLIGYGLVVGLKGTGDKQQTLFPAQSLANMLQQMGVTSNPTLFAVKNTAAVMVTGTLPAVRAAGYAHRRNRRLHGRRVQSARRTAADDQHEGYRRPGLRNLTGLGGDRRFRCRQGREQPDGESPDRRPRSGRRHD